MFTPTSGRPANLPDGPWDGQRRNLHVEPEETAVSSILGRLAGYYGHRMSPRIDRDPTTAASFDRFAIRQVSGRRSAAPARPRRPAGMPTPPATVPTPARLGRP